MVGVPKSDAEARGEVEDGGDDLVEEIDRLGGKPFGELEVLQHKNLLALLAADAVVLVELVGFDDAVPRVETILEESVATLGFAHVGVEVFRVQGVPPPDFSACGRRRCSRSTPGVVVVPLAAPSDG